MRTVYTVYYTSVKRKIYPHQGGHPPTEGHPPTLIGTGAGPTLFRFVSRGLAPLPPGPPTPLGLRPQAETDQYGGRGASIAARLRRRRNYRLPARALGVPVCPPAWPSVRRGWPGSGGGPLVRFPFPPPPGWVCLPARPVAVVPRRRAGSSLWAPWPRCGPVCPPGPSSACAPALWASACFLVPGGLFRASGRDCARGPANAAAWPPGGVLPSVPPHLSPRVRSKKG